MAASLSGLRRTMASCLRYLCAPCLRRRVSSWRGRFLTLGCTCGCSSLLSLFCVELSPTRARAGVCVGLFDPTRFFGAPKHPKREGAANRRLMRPALRAELPKTLTHANFREFLFQRVSEKASSTSQTPYHEATHGSAYKRLAARTSPLVAFAHPAVVALCFYTGRPGKIVVDDPRYVLEKIPRQA